MPGVVPGAQGRASRPGAVGGVATQTTEQSGPFTVGQHVEVAIEDVAQGGWCIARPEGLPVMFVRHALPGERVVARVTEVTSTPGHDHVNSRGAPDFASHSPPSLNRNAARV